MNLSYFVGCKSEVEAKKRYREKSKELHPDLNPTIDSKYFIELKDQFDYITSGIARFPIVENKQFNYDKFAQADKDYDFKQEKKEVDPIIQVIDALRVKQLQKDYQKIWLFYSYRDYIQNSFLEFEIKHLKYIGKVLGYKDGWADIKYSELRYGN